MEGRKPVGRPKKIWSKIVEEDMKMLNIMEDMAEDRKCSVFRGNSYQVQPQEWETRDGK